MKHVYHIPLIIPATAALFLFLSFGKPQAQVTLYCPEQIVANVPAGLCGAFLDYGTIEFNANAPLVDTQFIPTPGTFFNLGLNPIVVLVTAENGSTGTCSINFMVEEYPVMNCVDTFWVTMDEDCQATIAWETLLDPQQYGCPDDFTVNALGTGGQPLGSQLDASFLGKNWTFQVSNPSNNTNCTGLLILNTTPLPPAFTCPPDTSVTCNTPLDPSLFGGPELTGCFTEEELQLTFKDVIVSSPCTGDPVAFFVTRTWTAIDPFGNLTTCQQVVTGLPITLQDVVFPPNFDDIGEPRIQCSPTESYEILTDTSRTGAPTVNGFSPAGSACNFAVIFQDEVTQICGAFYKVKREWNVFDLCESEVLKHTQVIWVVDETAPDFSIPETLYVSTDPLCGPTSQMPPIDLHYECSDFQVQINTPFGVLGTNGGPLNIPLVPGTYGMDYTVTDDCQNTAVVESDIKVTSGIATPCPDDTTIDCDFFFDNLQQPLSQGNLTVLQQFGEPSLFINCNFNVAQEVITSVNLCGEGTITRNFTINTPGQGQTCQQVISVAHLSDFEVIFPNDTTVVCGYSELSADEPALLNVSCENIAVENTDSIAALAFGSCYRIFREWTVRNLCVAEGDEEDTTPDIPTGARRFRDGGDGVIRLMQIINVQDVIPPQFPGNCTLPDVCITGANCSGSVSIPTPDINECSPYDLQALSDLGIGLGPFAGVIPGSYNVTFSATDFCGNQSTCNTALTVKDCKAPNPVCFTNVTVVLEDTDPPSATLMANQLNGLSSDNCGGVLTFSFTDDVDDQVMALTCDEVGILPVQLWVTDESGNQAFCETTVQVQGTQVCLPAEIGGLIRTETGAFAAQVEVSNNLGDTFTTGPDGNYFFTNPEPGMTITPVKSINANNGVTTFDAVLLTKHVLGVQFLDSPYKMIAADANKSGTITTFDAVLMRKVILNIFDEFPGNTSWRFIPASYIFPNPANPWAETFPEVIAFDNDPSNANLDFVALKTGDLNNSANPLNLKKPKESEDNE